MNGINEYICWVLLIIPLWIGRVYSPVNTCSSPQVMGGREITK